MSQETLMQLFKFDQQDLEANRQGYLSEQQQKRWAEAGQWSKSVLQNTFPLLAAVFVVVTGIIITLIVRQFLIGILLTIAGAALVGGGIRLSIQRTNQTAPEEMPVIKQVEGMAQLTENVNRGANDISRRYHLEIAPYRFQLFSKEQFEALENGGRYVVHFMGDEDQYIVSIEKLTG